jgi:nucleoside-diphosphate-sugar epimerase
MVILVTGATGRVGTALVERLAARRSLRLLVRGAGDARARITSLFRGGVAIDALQLESADLADPALAADHDHIAALGRDARAVVHLAACTDFSAADPQRHELVNVQGALTAVAIAASAGAPLVLVSTAYVCGEHRGPFTERDLLVGQSFRNPYERSKARAELLVTERCAALGVPLTILRPGIILPPLPRAPLTTGPGPLVFLEFLARLEGRRAARDGEIIRYPGDPAGCLALVSLDSVVSTLAAALERAAPPPGVFHLTAAQPTTMQVLLELVNEQVAGLRIELAAPGFAPSRVETLLQRHCRPYEPYLFAQATFDRTRFEREFGPGHDLDTAALRGIFTSHAAAWREERAPPRLPLGHDARAIDEYFTTFLPTVRGRAIVPGVESLDVEFTVTIEALASFRLRIARGVLVEIERVADASPVIDYQVDAATMLSAVRGEVRPSELFFQHSVAIRGDLFRALATATVLEEFFKRSPFVQKRSA